MPKMKTNKAAAKRFSKTGTGKIKKARTNHRHLLTSKNRKIKRHQRPKAYLATGDAGLVSRLIPYK